MQACAAMCSHGWIGNNHMSERLQTHETSGAVCLGRAGTVPDSSRLTSMYFLRHATCSEQGCDGQSTALTCFRILAPHEAHPRPNSVDHGKNREATLDSCLCVPTHRDCIEHHGGRCDGCEQQLQCARVATPVTQQAKVAELQQCTANVCLQYLTAFSLKYTRA